jgi:HemY protein
MLATPRRAVVLEPPAPVEAEPAVTPAEPAPAAQDNAPPPSAAIEPAPPAAVAPMPAPPPTPEPAPVAAAPLFRARQDIPKAVPTPIPAVIPILRPPDDPGIDDEGASDEFAEQIGPPKAQAGGWRGFLSRWGGE